MKREKLKLSTILSYALATGSGYQIMGSLVGAYLMIFLTDTFGVPAGAVGVITVVASVWDAINDPMMGTIADRTKSRWGKYRPYFLFYSGDFDGCCSIIVCKSKYWNTWKNHMDSSLLYFVRNAQNCH